MQVQYSKKWIENINETIKSKNLVEIRLSEQDLTATRKMNDLPNTWTYTNQNQTKISSPQNKSELVLFKKDLISMNTSFSQKLVSMEPNHPSPTLMKPIVNRSCCFLTSPFSTTSHIPISTLSLTISQCSLVNFRYCMLSLDWPDVGPMKTLLYTTCIPKKVFYF